MTERWHGTLGGYTNHRCRCEKCRSANTARMREYRERSTEPPRTMAANDSSRADVKDATPDKRRGHVVPGERYT